MGRVMSLLKDAKCEYTLDHKLVRGLDYYTKTVFEIRSPALGAQDAMGGGGRYDLLIKDLGGPATPAVGFAFGAERVIIAAEKENPDFGKEEVKVIFVAAASETFYSHAFKLAEKLRNAKLSGKVSIEGPVTDKSLKSQLRLADKLGAAKVIIFGEDEFTRAAVTVRDMKTQEQKEIKLVDVINQLEL